MAHLLKHLQVYEATDMLGIERLKQVATNHIIRAFQNKSSAKNLAAFLGIAYSRLPDTDTLLRPTLTHAYAIQHGVLESHRDVMVVMERHERAVWDAARIVNKAHESRIAKFTEGLAQSVCRLRPCSCGGTKIPYPDVEVTKGIISIDLECAVYDETLAYKST